ncbi:MAG: hypothetical protein IJ137_13030 [Eubacterium sp.]|nr:hypothetical protein [Eubacterium sp.]
MKQKNKLAAMLGMIMMINLFSAGCRDMNAGSDTTTEAPGLTTESTAQSPDTDRSGDEDINKTEQDGRQDQNEADITDQNEKNGTDAGDQTDRNEDKSGNSLGAAGQAAEDAAEGAGQMAEDAAEGAGQAVDDIADGIGDAVDNLGKGAMDTYEDARDYLMGKLSKDNASAHYEFREEKTDLVSYNEADPEARGYEFSVYETDGNEKIGRYYVDKETGKIYRYMGKDSIESY